MLAALIALVALAHPPDPPPMDAVVLVVQGSGVCAGAFIDAAGTVATAYHCVSPGGRPRVTTHDGRAATGRVLRVDIPMDLALIAVPELAGGAWLPLAGEPPAAGDRVRALGHPYGVKDPAGFMEGTLRWSLSEGVVAAVGTKSLQITAPVNPGNSGGPVIDDAGALVGVVSRRLGGDGIAFAGRADGVSALRAGEGHRPSPLGGTLALESLISVLQPPSSGEVALGARLSASFRDRVVISSSAAFPLSARWDAVRFGESVWTPWDVRIALRQRVLRGQWTSHVDLYGALVGVTTLTGDDRISFSRADEIVPMGGVEVGIGGTAIDIGLAPTPEGLLGRYQVVLRWPGTFWMF